MKLANYTVAQVRTHQLNEGQRNAVGRIRNWVRLLCRNKCIDVNQVFVTPLEYDTPDGKVINKTLICICDHLPEAPMIHIPKALSEVTLEDMLGCYKLINFCTKK